MPIRRVFRRDSDDMRPPAPRALGGRALNEHSLRGHVPTQACRHHQTIEMSSWTRSCHDWSLPKHRRRPPLPIPAPALVEEGRISMRTRSRMRMTGESTATAINGTGEERDKGIEPAALSTVAATPEGPLGRMDQPPESNLPPSGRNEGTDAPEADASVTSPIAHSAHQPQGLSGGELSPSAPPSETAPPREGASTSSRD